MPKYAVLAAILLFSGASTQAPDVPTLVARHLKAMGGAARLHEVNSIRQTGTITFMDGQSETTYPFKSEEKRPNLSRVEYRIDSHAVIRAFDGDVAWAIGRNDTQPRRLDEKYREEMKANDFDTPFLDYKSRGVEVTFIGDALVGSRSAYQLKVRPSHGTAYLAYLDKETYLEIRRDYVDETSALIQLFKDHKVFDGLVRPTVYEHHSPGTSFRMIIRIENVDVNAKIPDVRFRPPSDLQD